MSVMPQTGSDQTGQIHTMRGGIDALGRLYSNNPDSGFWVRVVDYPAEDRVLAIARECVALGEVIYPIRSRDASLTQEATA